MQYIKRQSGYGGDGIAPRRGCRIEFRAGSVRQESHSYYGGEPMAENKQESGIPETVELVVSAERHQQLQDIVSYVKSLHHFIDPDMYDISMRKLEELEWCVEGVEYESQDFKECFGFTMQASWSDLMFLETVVMAADTYSHRKTTGWRVDGITDQGFDDLMKWLAKAGNDLRSKLKNP